MKWNKVLTALLCVMFVTTFVSCRKDRITYVQMIKRENKEVGSFMNAQGFKTVKTFPDDYVTPEKVFVMPEEGLYIRVIDKGNELPIDGKTVISCRFKMKTLSDRQKVSFDNLSPTTSGTAPICFVYHEHRDYLQPDPKATEDEQRYNEVLCAALQEPLKYVGEGARVQIVTSFRYGPNFTAEKGIPIYFEEVVYNFKK